MKGLKNSQNGCFFGSLGLLAYKHYNFIQGDYLWFQHLK